MGANKKDTEERMKVSRHQPYLWNHFFTTLVIDAHEERDVATFDIPGAYLHAEMPADKEVILKLRGHFVDIMCDINVEYRQYVRYEQVKKVLYLKVLRAIYGCIESALQWYNL